MYNKIKGYSEELDRLLQEMNNAIEEVNKQIFSCKDAKELKLAVKKRLSMSKLKSELMQMYSRCEMIEEMEELLQAR